MKTLMISILTWSTFASALPVTPDKCRQPAIEVLSLVEAEQRTQWARKCLPADTTDYPERGAIQLVDEKTGKSYDAFPVFGRPGTDEGFWPAPRNASETCANLQADRIVAICLADEFALHAEEKRLADEAAARAEAERQEKAREEAARQQREREEAQRLARERMEAYMERQHRRNCPQCY